MKYKAGDRVRIKTWNRMKQEFGLTASGNIDCDLQFVQRMENDMPRDRIITLNQPYKYEYTHGCYVYRTSTTKYNWSISEDMIECLESEAEPIRVTKRKLKQY